jgi:F0F1-type ATP synthase assembly protein I
MKAMICFACAAVDVGVAIWLGTYAINIPIAVFCFCMGLVCVAEDIIGK